MTVTSFDQKVLVLSSIRKPKRLTFFGSDEKAYDFLVKGCEDVRMDQRIEQIFCIMNEIFEDDPQCSLRDLRINNFQV